MFETIVALATPVGKSALAVIRLSGTDCFDVVNKVFSKEIKIDKTKSINYGYIIENGKEIDQVILLAYVSPHSFTGENSVEIISHGSMLIVQQIINVLLANGARMATNGEFSSRAFLNGKIDLIQAEAINDIINSTTKEAKDLSMLSLKGETSLLFKPIKNKLGELLSSIEVNIDYPEYEDIEIISKEKVINVSSLILKDIRLLISDAEKSRIYNEGVKIAIVGKPNVGKSSLLNALLKEDKAIVTDIAGTTRDVVEGTINISGVPVFLFDTAGLHDSEDKIEKLGIKKSIDVIEKADLVIFLIDETSVDEKLYSLVKNKKHLIVQNKADLIKEKRNNVIYTSAINNDVESLIKAIKKELEIGEVEIKPSFNNTRQLGILKLIAQNLSIAIEDAKNDEPIDLISTSIMLAYNASLDLLGKNNKNDLTDEIFSRFCVGK